MPSPSDIAKELLAIRSQLADLRTLEADKTEELATVMQDKRLEIPGVGVFERHRKSERKTWDNDGLRSAITRKLRNDEIPKLVSDDGEIMDEDETERALRVVFDCARPSWRLTPLRALDLNPDEYSQVTYGTGWSVQFTGSTDAGEK